MALIVILLGVAISLSRGSLLCVGAGWVVLLILSLRRASVVVRCAALIVIFLVAGYLATPAHTRTDLLNRFATPAQQRFTSKIKCKQSVADIVPVKPSLKRKK